MTQGLINQTINLTESRNFCFPKVTRPAKKYYFKEWNGRDGGLPRINPYTMTLDVKVEGVSEGDRWYGQVCRTDLEAPVLYSYFPGGSPFSSSAADLAGLNDLIDNLVDHDFNLSVSIAEGKETLEFIGNILGKIYKSLRYARRGDLSRALRTLGVYRSPGRILRGLPGYWLAYRYAVTPLISDVNGAMDYLESLTRPPKLHVRGRGKVNLVPGSNQPYMGQIAYWPKAKYYTATRYGADFLPDDYTKIDWSNPYALAWELIPFSFIIDWIIPIGDFLRARWFFNYVSMERGYRTRYTKFTSGYPIKYPTSCHGNNLCTRTDALAYRYWITVDRDEWSGSVPLPRIQNPLSKTSHWKRVADLTSLVHQTAEKSLSRHGRRY